MKFNVYALKNSAILYLYAQRFRIKIDPDYQRMGEIWTLDKKQLLIDSIINDFDIPKIYFHDLRDYDRRSKFDFAIVDGRQRLEAIWAFIDGDFSLADDFEYIKNTKLKLANLTYSELASKYPQIKQLFDANSLSVFVVQTDDLDLIEDMFSRLNEAVPLNAAEKRNAFGGPLPNIVKKISQLPFFVKNIKISNRRYQHRDLATKMLYLTYRKEVSDTKKIYLDAFFKGNNQKTDKHFSKDVKLVQKTLNDMHRTFVEKDKLLRSSGMVVLYYLIFEMANKENWNRKPSRTRFQEFEQLRSDNREKAEKDITKADYDVLEFDRLTQTPNDSYAIKFRLQQLKKFVRQGSGT